jgi:hypothetical protein
MEVEQRNVIRFFAEQGMKGVEIIDRRNKHYDRDALQLTHVYDWIKEVKLGRKDLSNVPPAGRAPDEGLDDYIAKALKEDRHLSTRGMAKTLNTSSTTVRNYMTTSLGMKCYHMRWVPHTLPAAQKAKCAEMAGSMLQTQLVEIRSLDCASKSCRCHMLNSGWMNQSAEAQNFGFRMGNFRVDIDQTEYGSFPNCRPNSNHLSPEVT